MLKRTPWPVVLQIVPELSSGGAERTTIEVAEAVVRAGARALVCSRGGRLEEELKSVGGELIRFPADTKNPIGLVRNALWLMRIIRNESVTLVHARSRAPAWSGLWAARSLRRPFVTTYHGIYQQKGAAKAFYNSVMARGDAVICNSKFTAAVVRARHPKAKERVFVIPRAVDLEKFNPDAVAPERLARLSQSWGLPSGARVVLFPARLSRWKGQEVAIDALAKLRGVLDLGGFAFVFAGDHQGRDDYKARLEAKIRAEALQGRAFLVGHCEDMPAAFKLAELAVIASVEPEAFGRVSIEAQAMGCPVIASSAGALPETLEPLEAAGAALRKPWLFEPGNADALAGMLCEALSAPAEGIAAIRQEGLARVRMRFAKDVLQLETLKVYDRLLGTQLVQGFCSRPAHARL